MGSKSPPGQKHKIAGLDELDVGTAQTDVPLPYFAGISKLDASWIMPAVLAEIKTPHIPDPGTPTGSPFFNTVKGAKYVTSKGKAKSKPKSSFGHAAGQLCGCRLDFISGILINNDLLWPEAKIWDSQIFKKDRIVIYLDGNAYQALAKTDVDPPAAPWSLIATPWSAGEFSPDDMTVKNGRIWKCVQTTSAEPPDDIPQAIIDGIIEIQKPDQVVDGWLYVSTPDNWAALSTAKFWDAGSIVAEEGQVYITDFDTRARPPAAPWKLFRIMREDSPNPLKITITDMGDVFLYWGTADQQLDAVNEGILSAFGHPPYRHRAIIVLKKFLFGSSNLNPPTVQVLGGRKPDQTLIVGASAELDADWQANPMTVIAEKLTHPVIGLGLPADWFNQVVWQQQADFFATNPSLYYISPMYTSLKMVRELIADLLGYVDAFIFFSTLGQLVPGHWPHGEAAPAFGDGNTIDRHDLVEAISWQSGGWAETANAIAVSFNDVQAGFKSRPVVAANLFNRAVTRRLLTQQIDRPHIVRSGQAMAWATEMAKLAGDQVNRGTLTVRAEKAAAIEPGSLFLLTDDSLQSSNVMKCLKKTISAPPTGTVKIQFETERGVSPQPYSPPITNPAAADGPLPAPITNAIFVPVADTLTGLQGYRIACLAARNNELSAGFEIWFQQADGVAFQKIGFQTTFAVAANIGSAVGRKYAEEQHLHQIGTGGNWNLAHDNFAEETLIVEYKAHSASDWIVGVESVNYNLGTFGFDISMALGNGDWDIRFKYQYQDQVPETIVETVDNAALAFGVITEYQLANLDAFNFVLEYKNFSTGPNFVTAVEGTHYDFIPSTGRVLVDGSTILAGSTLRMSYQTEILVKLSDKTPTADSEAISTALTADEIADNSLLLFAAQASNRQALEIMNVKAVRALGDGIYAIKAQREQYGTTEGGDGIYEWKNDIAFLQLRTNLISFTHQSFAGLQSNGLTGKFILAPRSAAVQADITDLFDATNNPDGLSVLYGYNFADPLTPVSSWKSLKQNDVEIPDLTVDFAPDDIFSFSFEIADLNGDLADAALVGRLGGHELTLWSQPLSRGFGEVRTAVFSIPDVGDWQIALVARDRSGRSSELPLTAVGDDTPVSLRIRTAPDSVVASPTIVQRYDSGKKKHFANLFCSTAGATIKYQIVPRFAAAGVNWINYTGVEISWPHNKTIYIYATKAAMTDSPVVSGTFYP